MSINKNFNKPQSFDFSGTTFTEIFREINNLYATKKMEHLRCIPTGPSQKTEDIAQFQRTFAAPKFFLRSISCLYLPRFTETEISKWVILPADIYLLKINNKTRCENNKVLEQGVKYVQS